MENPTALSIKNLIPTLSEQEKANLVIFNRYYEKYEPLFLQEVRKKLPNHPAVKVMWGLGDEKKEEIAIVAGLRAKAISRDHWEPYIKFRFLQGVEYAKSGLEFKLWYDLTAITRELFMKYLQDDFGTSPSFYAALKGMNCFLDIVMCTIGEAYIQEKNRGIKKASDDITSIFETTADCLFVLDIEPQRRYRFSTVNKSFQTVTGIPYDAIVGQYVNDIIPKESLELVLSKYEEAIAAKKVVQWEETSTYPTGVLTGVVSIAPVFDESGSCSRLVGSVHDVTERKHAEIEIKNLNEDLERKVKDRTAQFEAINKELEAFTYSVSHDLRAPLRAVHGYAAMLQDTNGVSLNKEGRRLLSNISHNAERMENLINNLLEFSHVGRKEMTLTRVDMGDLVRRALIEVERTLPNRAEITVGQLHDARGDYGLLLQVIINLLSNAIKYSSKVDHPKIEIKSREIEGEIVFSVSDNGAGFDMKYVGNIFGVFQRLHTDEEFEGTGVGLAVVQRIINRHGGRVWAEGAVNKGAVFYFTLSQV